MNTRSAANKNDLSPLDTAQEALLKGQQAAQEAVAMGRDAVREQVGAATNWAASMMKNQPLKVLGAAAAIGAVVALLVARR